MILIKILTIKYIKDIMFRWKLNFKNLIHLYHFLKLKIKLHHNLLDLIFFHQILKKIKINYLK